MSLRMVLPVSLCLIVFTLVVFCPDFAVTQPNCFFDYECGTHWFCCISNYSLPSTKCKCDTGFSGPGCDKRKIFATPISPSPRPSCEDSFTACNQGRSHYDPCTRTCYCHCLTDDYGEHCEFSNICYNLTHYCSDESCPSNYQCGMNTSYSPACVCVPRPQLRPIGGCPNGAVYNVKTKKCDCDCI